MRSRAEVLLRALGIAAVVAWIVVAMLPRGGGAIVARVGDVADGIAAWTRDASLSAVHVRMDATPDATTSAWLTALRRAGVAVSWTGNALAPLAIETYASAEPAGGTIVLTSGDTGVLSDALGPLDTLRGPASSVKLASFEGTLTIVSGPQQARVAQSRALRAESLDTRALFISGTANWESKFVIAALEEAGWRVDARLLVAPGQTVVQGAARASPDTSRHSAVILLDSAAAESVRGVESFARAGGGVVLAGSANRARRIAPLIGWRAGPRVTAPLGTLPGDTVWRGLSRVPLRLVSDSSALVVESRGGEGAVLARRHYSGRVLGVSHDETWRWRMAGGDASVAEHRAWWSRLVASVAMRAAAQGTKRAGAAPVTALHEALGPPSDMSAVRAGALPRGALANLLGVIALVTLLSEWMLRRARGAR